MALESTIQTERSFIEALADAKVLLDIPSGNTTFDSVLYVLINFAAEFMESYTNRKLKSRSYTSAQVDGNGSTELMLNQWPVTAASSLVVASDRNYTGGTSLGVWDGTSDMDSDDHVILHGEEGLLERVDGGVFPTGSRTVRLDYTAGYTGGASGTGTRFRQAQGRILAHAFGQVGRDPSIVNQSQVGLNQAFLNGTGPFSGKFSAVLSDVRFLLDAESRDVMHGGVSL